MPSGSEEPPNERRWEFLFAFSEEEFEKVHDACRGGPVSRMVQSFRHGSLQQQQEVLGQFLPRCRDAGDENMYVYECGHVAVRFFLKRDRLAVMVLNIERPEDIDSSEPPEKH